MTNKQHHPISIGRNIESIRKMKHIKQDVLAEALGVTRQYISKLEQKEEIEEEMLDKIAEVLGVTVDTIKSYNEDAKYNYIQNNYDGSCSNLQTGHQSNIINPLDKIIELVDENRSLYERVIQVEREKNALLEALLKNGKS